MLATTKLKDNVHGPLPRSASLDAILMLMFDQFQDVGEANTHCGEMLGETNVHNMLTIDILRQIKQMKDVSILHM